MQADIIEPLIEQHATDAAFYWQIIDSSLLSMSMDKAKIEHFHYLLQAHIDGLTIAGEAGWQITLNKLDTWESNGESFVCTILAFQADNSDYLTQLNQRIEQLPDELYQGVLSACKFLTNSLSEQQLLQWLQSNSLFWQAIALELYTYKKQHLDDKTLESYFNNQNNSIKIALCHYLATSNLSYAGNKLLQLQQDKCLYVCAEAVISLHQAKFEEHNMFSFIFAVIKRFLQQEEPEGSESLIFRHYLDILTRLAGFYLPYNDKRLSASLAVLPEHLKILLLAHHGDDSYLGYLYNLMISEEIAPLAFWGICMITGIDSEDDNFISLASEDEEIAEEEIDTHLMSLSEGLLPPNHLAIEKYLSAYVKQPVQLLQGAPVSIERCKKIFNSSDSIMVNRTAALWFLTHQTSDNYCDPRWH